MSALDALIDALRARATDPETRLGMGLSRRGSLPAPMTPEERTRAEAVLGFAIPDLLAEVYSRVANGGFGPGYGMNGLGGGRPDDLGQTSDALYAGNREPMPDSPLWHWPEGLLPICDWGCGISTCIDCTDPALPMVQFDPNVLDQRMATEEALGLTGRTLESWLRGWVEGVDLWEELYGMPSQ